MDIDWDLLVRTRDHQRGRARQRVLGERAATVLALEKADAAACALSARIDARDGVWSSLSSAPRALDAATLRQAEAYAQSLGARIQDAAAAAVQARSAARLQGLQLEACAQALRCAQGALLKAERMRDLSTLQSRRVAGARAEDAAEEAARRIWAACLGQRRTGPPR